MEPASSLSLGVPKPTFGTCGGPCYELKYHKEGRGGWKVCMEDLRELHIHFLLCCILSKLLKGTQTYKNLGFVTVDMSGSGICCFRHILSECAKLLYRTKLEDSVAQQECQSSHLLFTCLFLNAIQCTYPSHRSWISDGSVGPGSSQC